MQHTLSLKKPHQQAVSRPQPAPARAQGQSNTAPKLEPLSELRNSVVVIQTKGPNRYEGLVGRVNNGWAELTDCLVTGSQHQALVSRVFVKIDQVAHVHAVDGLAVESLAAKGFV
jgi:hypothetical protein